MGNLKREEKKEEAQADQLHVLNEEFAQAIIFKRNELLEQDRNKSKEDRPNDIYDQATKEIMQEYFNNDQLNMLPKPIMKTSLLTQMKNNRELRFLKQKSTKCKWKGEKVSEYILPSAKFDRSSLQRAGSWRGR